MRNYSHLLAAMNLLLMKDHLHSNRNLLPHNTNNNISYNAEAVHLQIWVEEAQQRSSRSREGVELTQATMERCMIPSLSSSSGK
jgi:hypothetical protein